MNGFNWSIEGDDAVLFAKAGRWEHTLRVPTPSPEMKRFYEMEARQLLIMAISNEMDEMSNTLAALRK